MPAANSKTSMSCLRPIARSRRRRLRRKNSWRSIRCPETPSTWVRDTVSYILNHRYSENKVTIFTTNYQDKDELTDSRKGVAYTLAERIGDQMRSRLFEMCKTITMVGNDFRKAVKQAEHHF